MVSFEYFDHTADMGMRAYGRDLTQLFTNSALGLFNLIAPLEQFRAENALDVLLKAPDVEELVWKWLRELHYLFCTQKFIFKEFEYKELSETVVWATCWGECFDPKRHESEREVKAVTHHEFTVTRNEQGWKAEVIFDI